MLLIIILYHDTISLILIIVIRRAAKSMLAGFIGGTIVIYTVITKYVLQHVAGAAK
jgi:hypothetical protein